MNRTIIQQFIVVFAGVAITMALFFYAQSQSPPVKKTTELVQTESNNVSSGFSQEKLYKLATATLSSKQKDTLLTLEKNTEVSGKEKSEALIELAEFWSSTSNLIMSAGYYEQIACMDSTFNNWKTAADFYFIGFQNTSDSLARIYAGQHAFNCYSACLRFDTTNQNIKVLQALSLIDGAGSVMNGVLLLKEVEKTDPDNELMNVTLGRLAIVSGQYEKAIERLERIIKLYPDNSEMYFHLGEAYRATGKKEEAIEMFTKCRQLETSPVFQKQIDEYIYEIKKTEKNAKR